MRSVISSCVPSQNAWPAIGRLTTEIARPSGVSTTRLRILPSAIAARTSARYFSTSMSRLPVVFRLLITSRNVHPSLTTSRDSPYISMKRIIADDQALGCIEHDDTLRHVIERHKEQVAASAPPATPPRRSAYRTRSAAPIARK